MKKIKNFLVHLLIGHYYTEKEVYKILHKMQYEMAQRIIGNRSGEKQIVPVHFFKENGKYKDTNPYEL